MSAPRRRTLLVISQVYVPDPASLGQHMADAAREMVRRGWRVVVLTSRRGYDDPSVIHPARETQDGVEIRRLPLASFGKRSMAARLLGSLAFLAQVVGRGAALRGIDAVLVATSPPMASAAALLIAVVRRVPITYWAMDLNPDQAVALGRFRSGSLPVRAFDALNRRILGRARRVVAMDRFMAARLAAKGTLDGRLAIVPPWPHEDHLETATGDAFRRRHDLGERFVFMYSGNHGPSHPLDTLLAAARRLADRDDVVFVFVGGGIGKRAVDDAIATGARNVRSLPYQPLAGLAESLSAADVHLVTFGAAMVGIVHPCKAYGAMAVGRPLFLVGPAGCPIAELIDRHALGWRVEHGDVDGAARQFRAVADSGRAAARAAGLHGQRAIQAELTKERLCGRFCDLVEQASAEQHRA